MSLMDQEIFRFFFWALVIGVGCGAAGALIMIVCDGIDNAIQKGMDIDEEPGA